MQELTDNSANKNKTLQEDIENSKEFFSIGIEHFNQKEFDKAIKFFTQAIKINSKYSEAYYNIGKCYKEKENYDLAKENYELAIKNFNNYIDIELNDEYCESYYQVGYFYESSKNYDLAIECYTNIINFCIDPSHSLLKACYARSRCYAEKNLYDLAIKDLDTVIHYDYSCTENYLTRYKYNINLNPINYESALEDLDKAIEYSDYNKQKNDIARLAYVICLYKTKNTKKAKNYLNFFDKQEDKLIYSELIKERIKLELETQQKEAAYKAVHQKEQEMISFFTHTMRNALATAPESLRQAIRLLGSEDYEKNQKHYEAINEITALFSTISLTDCLIDTFKQSINEPAEFKRAWQQDNTGNANPHWFIAAALRQSLNRIIFMEDATQLRALLNNQSTLIRPTRKAFIENVLPLDVNQSQQDVAAFYNWLESITTIEISLETSTIHFGAQQIKFSLLFAISSELILNALKYWSGTEKIQVHWFTEQENYIFSVKNSCKANASSQLVGTHKGLAFIKRLVELLGEQAQFNCVVENELFCAELKLSKTLLEG